MESFGNGTLDGDIAAFKAVLGDLWPWLTGKLEGFTKLTFKGKKPTDYADDEEAAAFLYEQSRLPAETARLPILACSMFDRDAFLAWLEGHRPDADGG